MNEIYLVQKYTSTTYVFVIDKICYNQNNAIDYIRMSKTKSLYKI